MLYFWLYMVRVELRYQNCSWRDDFLFISSSSEEIYMLSETKGQTMKESVHKNQLHITKQNSCTMVHIIIKSDNKLWN